MINLRTSINEESGYALVGFYCNEKPREVRHKKSTNFVDELLM